MRAGSSGKANLADTHPSFAHRRLAWRQSAADQRRDHQPVEDRGDLVGGKRLAARQPMGHTTPLEIAEALDGSSAETRTALDALREAAKQDTELQKNVNDCEALALLGRYYASKIRGACALAMYDLSGDKFEHDTALRYMGDALTHWKHYAAIRDAHYVPALYNRVGYVDVTALTDQVAADLDIARNWKPGTLKDDGKRAGSEKGFR